jgi:hypothetical protein
MRDENRSLLRYCPPASAGEVAAAERAFGHPLPVALAELYAEFGGVWLDTSGELEQPPTEDTEWWEWLPPRLLATGRNRLADVYARPGDERVEGFAEELARSVPVRLYEGGASFVFLTDAGGWGVGPGEVGLWDHDGGEGHRVGPLAEYLADLGDQLNYWR